MTFQFDPSFAAKDEISPAENSLLGFLDEHRGALLSAAGLLGGRDGLSLVRVLFDGIGRGGLATRGVRRRLAGLLALLSLQHVGDPERIESACFSEIDPMDPRVEEICLLTDGLRGALQALVDEEGAASLGADAA
ncbi:hypothetical protein [Tropicimonas aquimaris]|uniref:Uncharacterized protein n=1 Tax=Tropicimonas aquimaris TaxID=914152 RepID=A0ABW3IKI3_9RHOB